MARKIDRLKGTVRWFNECKGFGFITPEDGRDDVFVHQSSIKAAAGFRYLVEGEFVEFYVDVGDDGRTRATGVTSPGGPSVQFASYGSGDQRSPCYGCGEVGHLTRNCCLINGGRDGVEPCYSCGEMGHLARDCPATCSLLDSPSTMLETLTDKEDEAEEDEEEETEEDAAEGEEEEVKEDAAEEDAAEGEDADAAEEDAAEEDAAEEDEAEEDEAEEDEDEEEETEEVEAKEEEAEEDEAEEDEAEEDEVEVQKAAFAPLNCSLPSSLEVLRPPPLPVATEPSTPPHAVVVSGEPLSSVSTAFSPLPKIKAFITCMKQIREEEIQLLTNLERYLKAMDLQWSDTIMEINVLKGALAEAIKKHVSLNHKIGAVADSQITVVVDLTHRCSALEERLAAMEAKMASVPTAPVIPDAVIPTTVAAENPVPIVDVVKAPTPLAAIVEVSTLIAVAAEEASVSALAIAEAPSSVMVFEGLASVGATSVVPTLGEVAGRVFTEGYELALINMAKEGALPVSFLANSRVVPPSLPRYHELHCLALLHGDKIPPIDSAT